MAGVTTPSTGPAGVEELGAQSGSGQSLESAAQNAMTPTIGENLENFDGFYTAISSGISNRFYFYYKFIKFINAIPGYNSGYEPSDPISESATYSPLGKNRAKTLIGASFLNKSEPKGLAGMLSFDLGDKKISLFPGYTPENGISSSDFFGDFSNRESFESVFLEFNKRADRAIELARHFLDFGYLIEDIASAYNQIFFENESPVNGMCGIKILSEAFRDFNVMREIFERFVEFRGDSVELEKGHTGGFDWFSGAALDSSSISKVKSNIGEDDTEKFNKLDDLPGNKYGITVAETGRCSSIGELFQKVKSISSNINFNENNNKNFGRLSRIEVELYMIGMCCIISETVHNVIDSRTDTNADNAFVVFDADHLGTLRSRLLSLTGNEADTLYGINFSFLSDSSVGINMRSFVKAHLQRVDRIKNCVKFLTIMKEKLSFIQQQSTEFRSIQNSGNLLQDDDIDNIARKYMTRESVASTYANLTKYANFSRSFRGKNSNKMTYRSTLTGFDDDDLNRIISLYKNAGLGFTGDIQSSNSRLVTVGIPIGTMQKLRDTSADSFDCYTDGSFVEINFYNLSADHIIESLQSQETLSIAPFQTFLVNTAICHTGVKKIINQNSIQSARNSVLTDEPAYFESLSRQKIFEGLTSNSFDSILQSESFLYYKPETLNESRILLNKTFSEIIADKFNIFGDICNVVNPAIALGNELVSATLKKYLAITSGVNMIEPSFPIASIDRLENNFFVPNGKINPDVEQIISRISNLNTANKIPDSIYTRLGQEIVNSNIYARKEQLRKIVLPSNFEKIYVFPIKIDNENFPLGSIFVDITVVS